MKVLLQIFEAGFWLFFHYFINSFKMFRFNFILLFLVTKLC